MSIIQNYMGYPPDYAEACTKLLYTLDEQVEIQYLLSDVSARHIAEDWGVAVTRDRERSVTIIDVSKVRTFGTVDGKNVDVSPSGVAIVCNTSHGVAYNLMCLLRHVKNGETSYTTRWSLKSSFEYYYWAESLAKYFGADIKYAVSNGTAKVTVELSHVLTNENGSVNGTIISRVR